MQYVAVKNIKTGDMIDPMLGTGNFKVVVADAPMGNLRRLQVHDDQGNALELQLHIGDVVIQVEEPK